MARSSATQSIEAWRDAGKARERSEASACKYSGRRDESRDDDREEDEYGRSRNRAPREPRENFEGENSGED
eukprot:IDg8865t1